MRAAVSRLPTALLLLFMVSGCAQLRTPAVATYSAPAEWSTAATATRHSTPENPALVAWPADDDVVLTGLLDRLERDNLELKSAAARLTASRAASDFAAAQRRPWLDGNLESARQRVPSTTFRDSDGHKHSIPPYRQSRYDAQFMLGYEIDLFGRLALLQEGAQAEQAARAADLNALHQRLRLETRLAYLALRHAESQLKESEAATALLQRRLDYLEARQAAGLVSYDALRPAREALDAARRSAASERAERHAAHSRIAVLIGTPPSALEIPPGAEAIPSVPGSAPADLPAAVIARRPDIAAAWNTAFAASHEHERIRRERWPRLTLTAAGGFISDSLGDWLRRDAIGWLAGLALQGPLLDGGRNEARQRAAGAHADAAETQYRQQVVSALGEVETALLHLQAARLHDLTLTHQVTDRQKYYDDTVASARLGRSDALARIDAELELLAARRDRLNGRHALLSRWHETRHSLGY